MQMHAARRIRSVLVIGTLIEAESEDLSNPMRIALVGIPAVTQDLMV